MAMTIDGSTGVTFPDATTQNSSPIGVGQTWQDVKASRAYATTYTNSTGKPIQIMVAASNTGATFNITLTISGVVAAYQAGTTAGNTLMVSGIIPNGATYSVTVTTMSAALYWAELR